MAIISYQPIPSSSPIASLNFTSNINNLSAYFQLVFDSVTILSSSTTAYFIAQISDDGGTTWKTSGYYNSLLPSITSGFVLGITNDTGSGNTYVLDGTANFNNLYWGTGIPTITGIANSFASSRPVISAQQISGAYTASSLVVNALRIQSSDGNNFYGNFYFYGM